MRKYHVIILKDEDGKSHFCEESAMEAVSHIQYTDKTGASHTGAHWSPEQIKVATSGLKFPEGTTDWDKYVAFNSFYADTCKVLDEPSILKAAHAFYFSDEDAPEGKVRKYVDAMEA